MLLQRALVCLALWLGVCLPAVGQTITSITFDGLADWQQNSGVDPDGQGPLSQWGGWTTQDGRGDQINAAAGFSGKGYRHPRGPGTNNNGGGLNVALPRTTDITLIWRMRHTPNLTWQNGQPYYTKEWWIGGDVIIGVREGNFYTYVAAAAGDPNIKTPVPWSAQVSGWHTYGVHMNASTGLLLMCFEGQQVLQRTVSYGGRSGFGAETFLMGENQSVVATGGDTDYDDVKIIQGGPASCLDSGGGSGPINPPQPQPPDPQPQPPIVGCVDGGVTFPTHTGPPIQTLAVNTTATKEVARKRILALELAGFNVRTWGSSTVYIMAVCP